MKRGYETLAAGYAFALLLCSCSDPGASRGSTDGAPAVPSAVVGWLGRWTGPEGAFLSLQGRDGGYEVTIQNLDGPRVFPGVAVGEQIRFERDGVTEIIRATDGAATGMKWLSDKSHCLTIRYGEGYCRD